MNKFAKLIQAICISLLLLLPACRNTAIPEIPAELTAINSAVNSAIVYKNDPDDIWQRPEETLALGTGDCEDYAVLKAHFLQRDLPLHAVRVQDEYHAILEVDGYFLDNRFDHVLSKEEKDLVYGPSVVIAPVSVWMAVHRGVN